MANYVAKVRTNYFCVTDEAKYLEIRRGLRGAEDEPEFWDEVQDGVLKHGFGCESHLSYCGSYGTLKEFVERTSKAQEEKPMLVYLCDSVQEADETKGYELSSFLGHEMDSLTVYHTDESEDGSVTRIFALPFPKEESHDSDILIFCQRMQEILPDGEAIILTETGSEKLNYLVGNVTVITKEQIAEVDLGDCALQKARQMLGNPEFMTRNDY